jgi:hypothetical protein
VRYEYEISLGNHLVIARRWCGDEAATDQFSVMTGCSSADIKLTKTVSVE